MKQAVKTFSLKMFTQKEEQLFTKFQKAAVFNGKNPRSVILALVEDWTKENNSTRKLVTETELLDELKENGLKTNKALLIKHRRQGNIDGMWFTNEDGRIVYDLKPVLKFFRGRQGRGAGSWLNRRSQNGNVAKTG